MKKKLLAWSICIALSATSVLAVNASTANGFVSQNGSSAQNTYGSQRQPYGSQRGYGQQPVQLTREQIRNLIESRRKQEKEMLYNTLKLTEEQKAKADEIDASSKTALRPLLKELHIQARKLYQLKAKKANIFAIWKQRFALNSAKNAVKKQVISSRNDFEAILTKEQKAQFESYEADKHKKMKEFKKNHKAGARKHMGPPPGQGMGPKPGEPPMGPPPQEDDNKNN